MTLAPCGGVFYDGKMFIILATSFLPVGSNEAFAGGVGGVKHWTPS